MFPCTYRTLIFTSSPSRRALATPLSKLLTSDTADCKENTQVDDLFEYAFRVDKALLWNWKFLRFHLSQISWRYILAFQARWLHFWRYGLYIPSLYVCYSVHYSNIQNRQTIIRTVLNGKSQNRITQQLHQVNK